MIPAHLFLYAPSFDHTPPDLEAGRTLVYPLSTYMLINRVQDVSADYGDIVFGSGDLEKSGKYYRVYSLGFCDSTPLSTGV